MFPDIILNMTQKNNARDALQPIIENITDLTKISTIVNIISHTRYTPVRTLFKVSLPYLP